MKRSRCRSILSMMIALAVVLSLSLLGACGSDDTSSGDQTATTSNGGATETTAAAESPGKGSADIIEPSQLISQEEAGLIMGVTMDTAENTEEPRVGLKITVYSSSEAGEFLQISLQQQAFMPPEAPLTAEEHYRATGDGGEKVEGIGDEAALEIPGLHVLVDGYYLVIGVGNTSDPDNIERLKEAGRLAVDNLRALIR